MVWGQTLGTDSSPELTGESGKRVYHVDIIGSDGNPVIGYRNSGSPVTIPAGGGIQIGMAPNTTVIILPNGGELKPTEGGGVTVPGGSIIQTAENGSTITLPSGGEVKSNLDGTRSLPGGSIVTKPNGTTTTVPTGGTVNPSTGEVAAPSPSHTHSWNGGWSSNSTHHWHECTVSGCGFTSPSQMNSYGEHIYDNDADTTCNICQYERTVTPPVTEYTIIFDANGGSVATTEAQTINGKLAVLPTPTRSCSYFFEGWYTSSSDCLAVTTNTVFTQDTTVYAHWKYTGSGGGGGYPSPSTYPITTPATSPHGKLIISPVRASRNTTVTITVTPEDGCRLGILNVTSGGKAVPLTEKGGGKYTFTMPAGPVKVEATFVPAETSGTLWNSPFADVSEGAWYYDAVRFVSENGLMGGNGMFGVNDNLSWAQLAQILFNKEGRPGVNYLLQYGDVFTGTWYIEAVRWATSQGIVGGYGNGNFGPSDTITREQLAVMLWRYSGSPAATNKELNFNDTDESNDFALEALRWAVENGIINGYGDGRLGPQGLATRAQVAQILKNFLGDQK